MATRRCRVCEGALEGEPLLELKGMPRAAQNFPLPGDIAGDVGVNLEVFQCGECGLVQLGAEPVPYHREVIRAAAVSRVVLDAKARQLAGFVEAHRLEGKRVLEVGCGRGEFLSLLGPLDVRACGAEAAPTAVEFCRRAGLEVTCAYPEPGVSLARGPVDAFLLLMFLEHMPRPNEALAAIRAGLTDGAVGLVEVPNFDMVVRRGLFSEFIPDHLLYFTRETLEATLRRNGFDVLGSTELRDEYVLSVEVRKRPRLDLSQFRASQDALRRELASFVGRFAPQRVAVWGAGHQALAALALSGIGSRLRYVVDSAAFKQGRLTPATHLPVVPPEALRSDPVDAVIVMASSYSDEVVEILRQRSDRGPSGGPLEVAVLRGSTLARV